MAIRSGFHRSIGEDRVYDAKFFADYFHSFIGNGVFPNPSTNLQVMALSNMTTVVKPGKGWINGWIIFNDSDFQLNHEPADGVLKRIDRVVLRLDHLTREITIAIKKGINANTPTPPTLERSINIYELAIADVLINNGSTTISQANITDTRSNTALCGYVAGVVQQLDTTTIYNQMLAALQDREDEYDENFQTWSDDKRQEFDDWFATIVDILDENVAANLQTQIDDLQEYMDNSGMYFENRLNIHTDPSTMNAHNIFNISGLQGALDSKAAATNYTAVITGSNWDLGAGYFINEVTVTGIAEDDKPFINPVYANFTQAEYESVSGVWSSIARAVTTANKITFYSYEEPSNVNVNIEIKVVR